MYLSLVGPVDRPGPKNLHHDDARTAHYRKKVNASQPASAVAQIQFFHISDEPQIPMFPQDVIQDILSRLPVKTLVRFRSVCRWWNSLIRDPMFIKLHLGRTIADIEETRRWRFLLSAAPSFRSLKIEDLDFTDDPDEKDLVLSIDSPPPSPVFAENGHVRVVGSCNGLLCLVQGENQYILWNPSTGEFWDDLARIFVPPKVTMNELCTPIHCIHGFGYDSFMNDYKIVRVTYSSLCATEVKMWILDVGSNSWRVFELRDQILSPRLFTRDAMFAYGSLHWASSRRTDVGIENRILSFSLFEEKFEEKITLPKFKAEDRFKKLCELRVVGGKLSVLTLHTNWDCTSDFEVWVLVDYGVKESWEKKVTLSYDQIPISRRYLLPLHFLRNGKVLVALNDDVMIYDAAGKTYQKVDVHGDINCWTVPLYTETLVSPFSVPRANKAIQS